MRRRSHSGVRPGDPKRAALKFNLAHVGQGAPFEVLLVEDNPGDVYLTRQVLLKGNLPVRLHVAQDGVEALQFLAVDGMQLDLILLDLNMPRLSGPSLLSRVPVDVPVVVFRSSANPEEIRICLERGARAFVRKPLDLAAFENTARGLS